MEFEGIEKLKHEQDKQRKWWKDNSLNLSSGQKEELFQYIIKDSKFDYFGLLKELTLDEMDNPEIFVENLERVSPYIDKDLSWNEFYSELKERIKDKKELSEAVYEILSSKDSQCTVNFGGIFLAELPEKQVVDEIISLLKSREETKIQVAVQAIVSKFKNNELPKKIIKELENLAKEEKFLNEILWTNSVLFKENEELWDLTQKISRDNPETIPPIKGFFRSEIDEKHLSGYLEIMKRGMKEEVIENPDFWELTGFSHRTESLAEFIICFFKKSPIQAGSLAEKISEKNDELLSALVDRINQFISSPGIKGFFKKVGPTHPEKFTNLVIGNYTPDFQKIFLKLLRIGVGEFYFSNKEKKDMAEKIANFLDEDVSLGKFVEPIDIELVIEGPKKADSYNKEVFSHLYSVISQAIANHDFDFSLLSRLSEYPNLEKYFRPFLGKKIRKGEYHPLLGLLKYNDEKKLRLLENNWDKVPQQKKGQLKEIFYSIFSEIEFFIWLEEREIDYETDITLHDYEEGTETDKEVDVKIGDDYIEIYTPELWEDLEISNRGMFIPNRASQKISNKFSRKFKGKDELTTENLFIAVNTSRSEIDRESIVSSILGKLKVIIREELEGDEYESFPRRDEEESLQEEWPIGNHLNGVIWYEPMLEISEGEVSLDLEGEVIVNPEYQDSSNNLEICEDLAEKIFG